MNKEKEITIKQSELDEIMKRMERLEKAANKARLANIDSKNPKETGKIVNLRMIDGRVITSWNNMTKNIVEKSPAGIWKEDQQVEITFEDGKKEKMPYVVFTRRYSLLPMSVKKEVKEEDGSITFIGETEDGKTYEISDRFIN